MPTAKKNKTPIVIYYRLTKTLKLSIMFWVRFKDKKKLHPEPNGAYTVLLNYATEVTFQDINEIQKNAIASLLLVDPSLYEYSFEESDTL